MATSVVACIRYCGQNTCEWLPGQKWASAQPQGGTGRAGLCCNPGSVGNPGCHGSGHCGSRELHKLLWRQQRRNHTLEHHSQGVQQKAFCEALLPVFCGVPLKISCSVNKGKEQGFLFVCFPLERENTQQNREIKTNTSAVPQQPHLKGKQIQRSSTPL